MESFTGPALFHYLAMEDKKLVSCFLLCQQLITEVLRIHYENESLIVNLCKSDAKSRG